MTIQKAQDELNIIEEGLLKYKRILKALLTANLEEYYGGPRNWPGMISPTNEESEEALIEVWNAAIKQAIDIVAGA